MPSVATILPTNSKVSEISVEEGDNQRAIASTSIAITKPLTTQDVDVEIWQKTSNTNDDRGEESLDRFYFLKLPHRPFHFEV